MGFYALSKAARVQKVIKTLQSWNNTTLVQDALDEIVDVHSEVRYAKFSALTQQEVISYITKHKEKT